VYTQCSKCETVFKLSAEVLRVAGGQVRCGRCGEVFNALARLAEDSAGFSTGESPLELETRADSILESVTTVEMVQTAATDNEEFAPPGVEIAHLEILDIEEVEDVEDADRSVEDPDRSMEFTLPPGELDRIFVESKKRTLPPIPQPEQPQQPQQPQQPAQQRAQPAAQRLAQQPAQPLAQTPAQQSAQSGAQQPAQQSAQQAQPGAQQPAQQPGHPPAQHPIKPSAPQPIPRSPQQAEQQPAQPATRRPPMPPAPPAHPEARTEPGPDAEADAELSLHPESAAADAAAERDRVSGLEVPDDVRRDILEEFDLRPRPQRAARDSGRDGAQRRFILWLGAAVVSALLLVIQVAYQNREWLAHGPFGAGMRALYGAMGASMPAPANLSAYQLRQWGVTGDPDANGTLKVRASILNTAAQLQPYPLLRVTLADRFGKGIGARDFEPSEYVGKPTARLLAPGERVDATLQILDPGKNAEGFEIDVCLRGADHRVTCANDVAPQAKR
jgi:predicted Zn finger-like uncharacterized protein